MEITVKLNNKDVSRILSALNCVIASDESLVNNHSISYTTKQIAETRLKESLEVRKKILNASLIQTLQNSTKGQANKNADSKA